MSSLFKKSSSGDQFFFYCGGFFSPSLLMNSCLGNIQWSRLQLVLFLAATCAWNASCLLRPPLRRLSHFSHFFSLFVQFTSFESSLFFTFTLRAWDQVCLSALARLWSFTGAPVFVSNSFDLVNCSSWRRDSISCPFERMSYILPQDHGVLASGDQI